MPRKLKKILPLLTSILMLFCPEPSLSWSGYDYEFNSEIEIGSGNLVRDGEVITFYDWEAQENRKAEVIEIEYSRNSTRLEIFDLTEQKSRIFEME